MTDKQTAADIAYANAAFIPDADSYPLRWEEEAREVRQREANLGRARLNHAYGPSERERLDLFHPAGPAQGLVVFVHGGYWLRFGREYWSHLSAGATERGWAVAMPSYTLAPEVTIADITRQVAAAIDAAATLVAGPIRLTGHSAGGHLVARMLCPDVTLAARDRVERVVPISPVSDLRPLIETSMNDSFRLTDATAAAESPVLCPAPDCDVTVWVGAEERPVFLDQARWLAEAWGCGHRIAPGQHHFDVVEPLAEPDSPLTRVLLD